MTDDLAARVAALEGRLGMESGLRASQDRDLSRVASAIDASRHLIQALAITQGEHTQVLAEHTARLARMETAIGLIRDDLGRVIAMLTTLIDREG